MSNVDHRTREVPPEIADEVRRALADAGANGAARALGIDRTTVLAVAAGCAVMPGTLALLRESIARRNSDSSAPAHVRAAIAHGSAAAPHRGGRGPF